MKHKDMNHYIVTWEIDMFCNSPKEAAKQALKIQRDKTSIATVFKVENIKSKKIRIIDLTYNTSYDVKLKS